MTLQCRKYLLKPPSRLSYIKSRENHIGKNATPCDTVLRVQGRPIYHLCLNIITIISYSLCCMYSYAEMSIY